MRFASASSVSKLALLTLLAVLVAACSSGRAKRDQVVQAASVPAQFDVTLIAEKDTQFDLDGAPLTAEDLKSAFRYRQEQGSPMGTVLLKRGEKQKVTDAHIVALARIGYEMKFKPYVLEKDGQISELRAQAKE